MRYRPYMIALDGPVDGQTEPTMHACAQHEDVAATRSRHGETHLPGEEYPVPGWGRAPADTVMAAIGVTRCRPWRRTWVAFLGTEAWAAEISCRHNNTARADALSSAVNGALPACLPGLPPDPHTHQ